MTVCIFGHIKQIFTKGVAKVLHSHQTGICALLKVSEHFLEYFILIPAISTVFLAFNCPINSVIDVSVNVKPCFIREEKLIDDRHQ